MAAMRTEVQILKFKKHPTGKIKKCLKCDEEVNKKSSYCHKPLLRYGMPGRMSCSMVVGCFMLDYWLAFTGGHTAWWKVASP